MLRTGTSQLYAEEPTATAHAAILFAAGCVAAAAQVLAEEIVHDGTDPKPWHMLLDLHRFGGDRIAFERLAERHFRRFRRPAPSWSRSGGIPAAPGMARLEGVVAAMKHLAPIVEQARHRKMVGIDMGNVERIDFAFAAEMCALLRGYGSQGKRIILGNVSELHAELLEAVGGIREIVLLRGRAAMQERLAQLQAA